MNRRFLLLSSLFATVVVFFGLALPAQASPPLQLPQYATPTPMPDGRIIYIVKEGDNCISIAALNGLTLDQLYGQNPQLSADCSDLTAGMQLLIGIGGPAAYTPTPGPSPTPTAPLPTPTPFTGTTQVCILLFDDINGNGLRETAESGLAGGEVSMTDVNGMYSQTQSTVNAFDADQEPVQACFTDVPAGTYNISVAIPEGYNPTREMSYKLDVQAGDLAFVDFGAQSKSVQAAPAEPAPTDGGRVIPWAGILGALLLLGGMGLGWYAMRARKPPSRLGRR
ncbi:MAG TPA: LysM peptidoglycan-binding domain-containing protein [Anaerolineales bacterium]|nr:LysM peptidoglycan-binding domain-containing protein [Anaerolineales bacterium]